LKLSNLQASFHTFSRHVTSVADHTFSVVARTDTQTHEPKFVLVFRYIAPLLNAGCLNASGVEY